jgi:hypothetical protein
MTVGRWMTAVMFLGVLTATPAVAQEGRSRGGDRGGDGGGRGGYTGRQATPRDSGGGGRVSGGRGYGGQRSEAPRVQSAPPRTEGRQSYAGRDQRSRGPEPRRDYGVRTDDRRGNDARAYAPSYRDRAYVGRAVPRAVPRGYVDRRYVAPQRYVSPRYYGGGSRYYGNPRYYHYAPGYGAPGWRGGWGRTYIVPRYVHPRVVTVLPWQPYYYRPSIALGVYYGADDLYPFGAVPNYYYDPSPGVSYGGVRITDAPRDAQVFADGNYAGIVDDFDGVLQHLNLEPGPHRIEIHTPGAGAVSFDVVVQPGRTITLRADNY